MAKAKVLYIHITGVSSEIIKNLVLAGIRAVLCDNRPYPDAVVDTPSFFLPASERHGISKEKESSNDDAPSAKKPKYGSVAEAVKPVVEELNPLLGDCEIAAYDPADLTPEYLAQFSIVIASRLADMEQAVRICKATIAGGGMFYMVDTFGMQGAAALDLGPDHEYRPEVGKKLLDPTKLATYVPLDTLLQVHLSDAVNRFHKTAPPTPWAYYRCLLEYVTQKKVWPNKETASDFCTFIKGWIASTAPSLANHADLEEGSLKKLAQVATCEVAPVCAVLGGIVGNEIIKAISGKGEPANNTLCFDGSSCKALTFLVQPKN